MSFSSILGKNCVGIRPCLPYRRFVPLREKCTQPVMISVVIFCSTVDEGKVFRNKPRGWLLRIMYFHQNLATKADHYYLYPHIFHNNPLSSMSRRFSPHSCPPAPFPACPSHGRIEFGLRRNRRTRNSAARAPTIPSPIRLHLPPL